jgi:hypothetical protein
MKTPAAELLFSKTDDECSMITGKVLVWLGSTSVFCIGKIKLQKVEHEGGACDTQDWVVVYGKGLAVTTVGICWDCLRQSFNKNQ